MAGFAHVPTARHIHADVDVTVSTMPPSRAHAATITKPSSIPNPTIQVYTQTSPSQPTYA